MVQMLLKYGYCWFASPDSLKLLRQPHQYFWLHKRFKSRPEGEADFYRGGPDSP